MDTFCVSPWFGREMSWNGAETHCCWLPTGYDISKIQQDMLANRRPKDCYKCWNSEDNNITSDRQLKNAALDFYWDRDLSAIYKDAVDGQENTLMLKLFTSYTCNSTCVSCSSNSSSSWAELDHRMNPAIPIKPSKFIDLNRVKAKVNFQELKMLSLIGGEPLYEKRNIDLLEYILELGNDSVFITMVTNGSVTLSARQKNVLSKFPNLNINVSIDGVGSVFEYLRFPLKWDKLLENLKFFKQITDNISCTYTISNLNILYHPETTQWFDDNQIRFLSNPVYVPAWLQPRALPMTIKEILKQKLCLDDYNAFIGSQHTEQDQKNFETFLTEIKKQDRAKKINMDAYLPELSGLIASHINSI